MNRILTLLSAVVAVAIAWAAPASAQGATAKLYAKAEGDDVLVAIQVRPDFGCYFYDKGEDVGGMPTVVTMGAIDGAGWTPVWFPEPKIKEDQYVGTSRIFDKKTVLYAAAMGAAKAGVEPKAVTASILGQVCNESQCIPWEVELEWRSAGTDALWADFPKEILAAAPAPSEDAGTPADDDDFEAPTWEPDFGEAKAMARAFGRELEDGTVELVVQVATPEHWHMYHGPTAEDMGPGLGTPTVIEVEGGNVDWEDAVQHPRPFEYVQEQAKLPDGGWLWAYEGTFHFGIRGEAYDDFDPEDVTITITGQSCDDAMCLDDPVEEIEVVAGGDEALYRAAFASWTLPERGAAADGGQDGSPADGAVLEDVDDEAAEGAYGQKTDSSGLLGFILLAIGAGLFTLLMPCTYPMIPITISFFTKQAEQNKGGAGSLAIVYGLGIVLMFILLGVAAGPIIVPFATHPVTNVIIGVLFVVFALALFGAITLNPPQFLMGAAGKASNTGGYIGVFLMGLTLVITSFTCTAPFVGSLIAAGAEGGYARIMLGMGAFGATMATPFVFLALVPGKLSAIPSAGGWMNTVKVFMGFVELAASLKFFSNADIALQAGWLPREVFLMAWAGIGFVAAMYLFGRINLKGESPDGNIGPWRMCIGTGTLLGALYCFMGVQGYKLDGFIMAALAPPPEYTRGLVESHRSYGGEAIEEPTVIIDDYDTALLTARAQGKGLLVNFTGHT